MERECKKCLLYESAEYDILEAIKKKIEGMSQEDKSSDAVYEERLLKCKVCEYLVSGTCMKCGCYVEFRAAFKNQRCPDASDRKW